MLTFCFGGNMNQAEARAVLGVGPNASVEEAKRAYRQLIKVFHVDRMGTMSKEDQESATNAMVRLNHAWEVVQRGTDDSIEDSALDPGSFKISPRGPSINECRLCGGIPAQQGSFRSVYGFLLRVGRADQPGPFCRSCAEAMYRSAQNDNWRAWWGLSVFPAITALLANRRELRRFENAPRASFRDPAVQTPFPRPLPPIPNADFGIGRWLSPVLACCVWGLVCVMAFGGFAASGSSSNKSTTTPTLSAPTPSPTLPPAQITPQVPEEPTELGTGMTAAEYVGTCWNNKKVKGSGYTVKKTFCFSTSADYEVTRVVRKKSSCSRYYLDLDFSDGKRYACVKEY